MDPQYIKPFIASIQNVFSTMMQLPVTVQAPKIKDNPGTSYDVQPRNVLRRLGHHRPLR